ncbi:MAG: hypothetical protein HWE21_10650 [Cytophagia bacterium]|nr:hypothetical protein [Cytophagia bacterium]NVK84771.1 hypothetical protein [Cytophagia bacterium]
MSNKYIEDIAEIRQMMEKSSRFISLSGLSGIMAGIYALIGAFIAWKLAYTSEQMIYGEPTNRDVWGNLTYLILDAAGVFLLTLITGIGLSVKKAKKHGVKSWDKTTQKLIINLFIPLIAGGILIIVLYLNGIVGLIAPTTLIFYGLGLINASHYTYRDIRYLGLLEVALGLIASFVVGYGLLIWAIGFGLLHIVYGTLMYFKYDK